MLAWITATLTFALMGITAFYAWSNYRVMRIMETDFRARTQPIPKLGIHLSHDSQPGTLCSMNITIRTENAPMKLKEIGVLVFHENERTSSADCLIGDPRIISPLTPAEFTSNYISCGQKSEWRAVIIYTDLGEAFEYHTKVSERGFSLTTVYSPPGLIRKLLEKAKEQIDEMDQE
jgi:hypothetical protein